MNTCSLTLFCKFISKFVFFVNEQYFFCWFFFFSIWHGEIQSRQKWRIHTLIFYLMSPEKTWLRQQASNRRLKSHMLVNSFSPEWKESFIKDNLKAKNTYAFIFLIFSIWIWIDLYVVKVQNIVATSNDKKKWK